MSRPSVPRHPHRRRCGALGLVFLLPLALAVAPAVAPAVASASAATAADADGNQLARDRALAAETANRLDAAEAASADLEHQISTTKVAIGTLQHEARRLRAEVRRRAASLYTTSGTHLNAVVQSSDVLAGARAAQLTEVAGRSGLEAVARLGTITAQLQQRATQLGDAQDELERNRKELEAERDELAHRIDAAVAASRETTSSARGASVTPVDAAAGAGDGASDDVWLRFRECTFAHESGGDYGIVSPDGLYYGAWQFLPSTWNSIAAGMGRPDLVGVLPSEASGADQDAVAHALWSQAGNQPWGGRC